MNTEDWRSDDDRPYMNVHGHYLKDFFSIANKYNIDLDELEDNLPDGVFDTLVEGIRKSSSEPTEIKVDTSRGLII